MFTRDTFRLIRATIKRFVTIMLMVFIGAGFMVGLMSSSSVLQNSVDVYDDEYVLMDIQIYSSYGFCEEDVEAIAATEGVEAVYASRFIDAYGSTGEGTTYVTRIQELDSDINKYELVDGRMPEADDEALVLESSYISGDISIGDTIVVYLDDEEISDSLVNDTYTIVGVVTSPQYLAKTLETSTLNNYTLNTVLYVPNDNLISEYYTTVYVTIEGASDETSYSDAYQAIIDAAMVDIETMAIVQQDYLKAEIVAEAEEEIAEAEKELEEEIAEADAEIAEAMQELEDAYEELILAQEEVDDGWISYYDSKEELEDAYTDLVAYQKEVDDGWEAYYDGLSELEQSNEDLADGQEKVQAALDEIYENLGMGPKEARTYINSAISDIDTISDNLSLFEDYISLMFDADSQSAVAAINTLNSTQASSSEKEEAASTLKTILERHITLNTSIVNKASAINTAITSLETTLTSMGQSSSFDTSSFSQIQSIATTASSNLTILNNAMSYLSSGNYSRLASLLYRNSSGYFADKLGYYTLSTMVSSGSISSSTALSSVLSYAGQESLATYAGDITVGQFLEDVTVLSDNIIATISSPLSTNKSTLNSYLSSINTLLDSEQELISGSSALSEAEQELASAYQTLVEGQITLSEGWTAYYDGLAELSAAYDELVSAQNDIDEAWIEYEEGLEELEAAILDLEDEIAEAQSEIADAKQTIADLPEAEWTVLDRTSNYSQALFEGTVEQMANIGYVFPLLFFLVAALVCLTTMTRLIDEQRNQIGVFSALGFSKQKIISKYLIYACVASLIGAVVGIPIGLAIYPVVIYNTWQLMYYLPTMQMAIDLGVVLLGILSFTVLMVAVTFFVAWKSLSAKPAELLRPKAPKEGKTIMLEHAGPIWKRLSFISKINARNIFRYKARFLMTIIGVAGCTSLLVLGFGIKDSISGIIDIQYGEIFTYNETIIVDEDYTDTLLEELKEDDNVSVAVSFLEYSATVYLEDEEIITVEVFDSDEIADVVTLRDRKSQDALSISGSGVIISEKFAKTNDLEVGDTITIESSDGKKGEVTIDGICELYFQHYLFMSNEVYEATFGVAAESDKIAIVSDDAELLQATYGSLEEVESIAEFSSAVDNFQNMISALDYIVIVIIFVAGSLALVVLINLSEVNISERVKEIATFKVLGFYDKEVNAYIFKELIFLTLVGAIIGLPLGKLEHTFVMGVIDMDMLMYGEDISLISYGYSVIITFVFTFFVLVIMSRSIRKVKMVESLKSVE